VLDQNTDNGEMVLRARLSEAQVGQLTNAGAKVTYAK
jgi:hypothetical protein